MQYSVARKREISAHEKFDQLQKKCQEQGAAQLWKETQWKQEKQKLEDNLKLVQRKLVKKVAEQKSPSTFKQVADFFRPRSAFSSEVTNDSTVRQTPPTPTPSSMLKHTTTQTEANDMPCKGLLTSDLLASILMTSSSEAAFMLKQILEATPELYEGIHLVQGRKGANMIATFTRSDNLATVENSMDTVEAVVLRGIMRKTYFTSGEHQNVMSLVTELNRFAKKFKSSH